MSIRGAVALLLLVSCAHSEIKVGRDPELRAIVRSRRPLLYSAGADSSADRPAHVRAASGLVIDGDRAWIVQDDASIIATVDLATSSVAAILLPAGEDGVRTFDDGRGNKNAKLDFESCVIIPAGTATTTPVFLAFGSGSNDHRRRILWLEKHGEPRLIEADRFYEALKERHKFSGAGLNVEGAVWSGKTLRLFQRGAGEAENGREPLNAIVEISAKRMIEYLRNPSSAKVPALRRVRTYELGTLRGVRLGFSDATAFGDRSGKTLFLAAAEDTKSAVTDGEIRGTVLGVIDLDGSVRWTELTFEDGAPFIEKAEGLAVDLLRPGHVYVVIDPDDPRRPAELLDVHMIGSW